MSLRLSVLVCACLLLSTGCRPPSTPPAVSKDESKAADPGAADVAAAGKDDWKKEFARMQAELELSDAEDGALQVAFEAREADVSAWMAEKGPQLESLESKMKSAARSKDLTGVRKAIAQAKPLREELRAIMNKAQEAIPAVLSDANQTAWKVVLLRDRLLELMEPLQLTAEQVQQIHTETEAVVPRAAGEVNPEAAGFLNLEKVVESRILTPSQKTAYEPIKKKKPMRSLY